MKDSNVCELLMHADTPMATVTEKELLPPAQSQKLSRSRLSQENTDTKLAGHNPKGGEGASPIVLYCIVPLMWNADTISVITKVGADWVLIGC